MTFAYSESFGDAESFFCSAMCKHFLSNVKALWRYKKVLKKNDSSLVLIRIEFGNKNKLFCFLIWMTSRKGMTT